MTISALPTPPSALDTPSEFNTKASNLLGALPDFVTEANALLTDVNAKSSAATSAASSASSSATSASNSAAAASASAAGAAGSATSASGSASSAASSAATALSEANRAAAAAATVDLPAASGNALKLLRQNAGNTGLEYFSIVGPVSQSSGVPTGAIIESGNNDNGYYVRYADGVQICWANKIIVTTISGVANGIWNYPATFADVPTNVLSILTSSPSSFLPGVGSDTTSNVRHYVWSNSAGVSISGRAIAVGRWF